MSTSKIAVVGLGYVGLPLAVALARHYAVSGYDHDPQRVRELSTGHDRTGEVTAGALAEAALHLTAEASALVGQDIYIITVPTPVDRHNLPDLSAVSSACRTVGGVLSAGAIVVLESTVYPGVTEEVVGPELAAASGLRCGIDFFLGYSPERINPGDRQHTVERITKVVAGETEAATSGSPRCTAGDQRPGVRRARSSGPPRRPRRSRMRSATSTSRSSTRSR